MAIIGPTLFGTRPFWYSTSSVNTTVDASDDGFAIIFQAEEAMTITQLGVLQVAAVSAPTYKIGFQGITSAGIPDGTFTGGGSENSVTFTPVVGGDGAFQWYTLDNARTVARGELLCMVVVYDSGTIGASNDCTWNVRWSQISSGTQGMPYSALLATTWTKDDEFGSFGYRSSTESYGCPIESFSNITFDDDSDPDEYGIAFTVPPGSVASYQVLGFEAFGDWNGGTTVTGTWTLYSDTTTLQEATLTGQFLSSSNKDRFFLYFDEAALSTLSPGTEYIIALTSDSTTQGWGIRHSHFAAAQDAAGCYELGLPRLSPRQATRVDSGSWSFDDTLVPQIVPILYDLST